MTRIEGKNEKTIGVRLRQEEMEADPELFYQALNFCRSIWHKTDIVELDDGVRLQSALAWEHHQPAYA